MYKRQSTNTVAAKAALLGADIGLASKRVQIETNGVYVWDDARKAFHILIHDYVSLS